MNRSERLLYNMAMASLMKEAGVLGDAWDYTKALPGRAWDYTKDVAGRAWDYTKNNPGTVATSLGAAALTAAMPAAAPWRIGGRLLTPALHTAYGVGRRAVAGLFGGTAALGAQGAFYNPQANTSTTKAPLASGSPSPSPSPTPSPTVEPPPVPEQQPVSPIARPFVRASEEIGKINKRIGTTQPSSTPGAPQ